MKKEKKNRQMLWKMTLTVLAVLGWSVIPFLMQNKVAADGSVPILVRTAILASPTGSVNPHGEAEYQVYQNGQRELEIEVEDVNSADGTVLTFFVGGNSVGQTTLSAQRARLKLRTESGQNIPTINEGSTIEVRNGNVILVRGAFGGVGTNPTPSASPSPSVSPSPTASPNGTPSPSPTVSPSPSPSNESKVYAVLTGATINGVVPRGIGQYEVKSGGRRELEIYLNQINLAAGTRLSVLIDGVSVGQIALDNNRHGELELETEKGQNVPLVALNSTIAVQDGSAVILSGKFTNSTSPTATFNSQGRYFEAHLNGANVTPPVVTGARAEVKILLNFGELAATAKGEFYNLSSPLVSAKIMTDVGSTSVVIAELIGGGQTGEFVVRVFSVTPEMVQQLRTGMWYVVIATRNNPNGEVLGRFSQHSNSADFDGDGGNDLAVFRPSEGNWYIQNSQGFRATTLGSATDKPVSGDYDGDGKTDAAVFKNVNNLGVWEIKRSSDSGITGIQFGLASDIPVHGDFDGDGRNDLAVFRPSDGNWYFLYSSNGSFAGFRFGLSGDKPVAGDFDGDGRNDIAVYRPSEGNWYISRSSDGNFQAVHFGSAEDKPVAGDFDGDGRADYGVFRPSNGVWYVLRSSDGGFFGVGFGLSDDIPVPGNYDSDDKTDVAVFRPSTGYWYVLLSTDGSFQSSQFGTSGDIPTVTR